jgi:hypothetical protein
LWFAENGGQFKRGTGFLQEGENAADAYKNYENMMKWRLGSKKQS